MVITCQQTQSVKFDTHTVVLREVLSLCHRIVSKYIECWCEDAALMTDQSQLSGDQDLVSTDSAP